MKRYVSLLFFLLLFNIAYTDQPFEYDLHLSYTPGKTSNIMITAHGMGGNHTIARNVKSTKTLLSFNFPDYDYGHRNILAKDTTYGTIKELLPLLYVLKKCVLTDKQQAIDLYGFSAGGGAIINTLGVLNTSHYDKDLEKLGIYKPEKQAILQAIEHGLIILDAPLKSVQEIIDFRGHSEDLDTFLKRYEQNDMEPIEALKYLKGLSLHMIVHFQNPDEVLSNRDDMFFFHRLKKYNARGTTKLIVGNDGGHNKVHHSLWKFYAKGN